MNFAPVPILECAFALNVSSLLRASRRCRSPLVAVSSGDQLGVVVLAPTQIALFIDGAVHHASIVAVSCLNGRSRALLKCPRAHEGNFLSLYYCNGVLACRHCHRLRYRTTLASSAIARARIARSKLLQRMGAQPGETVPIRKPGAWRKRYGKLLGQVDSVSGVHYGALRKWLSHDRT